MDSAALPVCATCGTQYPAPRPDCFICLDERQYVPRSGQRWTSLGELRAGEYRARIESQGPGVTGIGSTPSVAIGQRPLLVKASSGNVLWDCAAYLDDDTVEAVTRLGGITAIAISHPHFYTTMVEWARTFDVPVYLHESDSEWIARPDDRLRLWRGTSHQLSDELTLLNLGVHFTGGTVMHWSEGTGSLFTGDIVQVLEDPRWVTFMYSYPMMIPERPSVVRNAVELLAPYRFEAIYGAWWGKVVPTDGEEVVRRSAARYLDALRD